MKLNLLRTLNNELKLPVRHQLSSDKDNLGLPKGNTIHLIEEKTNR